MIGPTGVGKTYMIKRAAELIGVPFVKSDATKFTETGYQGGDVDDLVRQLYKKADKNIKMAEFGIIYLDEIDKITGSESKHHKDVSGRGVQSNLLKLMEDTEVPTTPAWDVQSQIKQMMSSKKEDPNIEKIQTKNILFIVSGAFNGLDSIINKRLGGKSIGFERTTKKKQKLSTTMTNLRTHDLIEFGLEPEFTGRLPVKVTFDELEANDLYDILTKSEESILDQYIHSFKRFGIEVSFDDSALKEIATISIEEKTGARALATTLEKIFRNYKFELPSTNINYIYADKQLIKNPEKVLAECIKKPKEYLKKMHL